MTLADISSLAEIISALGVIAGLIFVGIQLRHATVQMRRAEANATNSEATVLRHAIFTDGEFAEIVSAAVRQTRTLDVVEADRMTQFLWEIGFQALQFWDRTRHGLFSRQEFEGLAPTYLPYLTCPLGLQWWRIARTVYRPDFVADIEKIIPALAPTEPIPTEAAS